MTINEQSYHRTNVNTINYTEPCIKLKKLYA